MKIKMTLATGKCICNSFKKSNFFNIVYLMIVSTWTNIANENMAPKWLC